ncbi:unnamed protein product [Hermetia illucens]|uniref:Ig-like domain-containing protein n=1 Tax=Hermetia illucens TaxID=343691 RepID=A0A7R8UK69_HERIL|nr:unnamed protein product [Hermetia illucens]
MKLTKLVLLVGYVLSAQHVEVNSYDLVELYKISEHRDNSSDLKEPSYRRKRDVPVALPVEGQTSLVFIFDDTGSMGNDLAQLRKGAKKITNEFANRKNNPIYNYILVCFNDPYIHSVTVVYKASKMLEALDKVTIMGGGDCPELAMKGIIIGMVNALPRSHIFVFSDASAKDHARLPIALKFAQKKQLTVNLLITGHDCVPIETYEAYTELARQTHGQVYNMEKTNVEEVVESIAEVLDTDMVPLESIYSEAGGTHDFDVFVDSAMKKISATVSGDDPKIDVYDPRKELSKDVKSVLDLDKVKMVKVDDPEPGKWGITTSSTSPHSIKISGTSDILVRYGFSFIVPEQFSDTDPRPIKDITNYLSVFVWKNKRNHTFTHAELVIVTRKSEKSYANHTLRVLDPSNCDPDLCIHVTTPFLLPLSTFKIYVRGFDSDGNAVKYLVSTNINAVEGEDKPKVNVTEKEVRVKEDDDVQFICKVSSVKRAEITWIFEAEPVEDSPRRRVNFKKNDTVHLDFYGVTLDDIGNYFCQAKNPYGQDHEKVSLFVEPIPWQIEMAQTDMQATEHEANFEIKCTITPEKRLIPVQWLFNGEHLSDSAHFTVAGRTLKLHGVNRKHDGTYTCIGTHNGISLNSTGYLKVLYQPEIFGPLLEKYIVKYEDRVMLDCTAEGNPKPIIKWTRESGETSSNIIEKFTPSHYGAHICEASNGVGKPAKKYVILETQYGLKPKVLMDMDEVSVTEEERVELTCEVVSAKPVKVSWKFNDEVITPKDESRQITSAGDMHILMIPKAELEHAGDYTCVAENFNGTDDGNVFLQVEALSLDIKMVEPDMEVLEDASYEIECIVSPTKRRLNLKWMFGDKVLHNSSEFQIAKHKLLIKRVSRTHTGYFTCTGEFYGKTKRSVGYLNVLFKPEIIGPDNEKHVVEFGAKIDLNCTAIGNPKPKITWFREDGSNASATIEKFNPSHYGNYRCEASNEVGAPALKFAFLDSKAAKKPELIYSDYYHEVRTGQNLTLKCGCEQCGPIFYKSWSRVATDNQTEITGVEGVLEKDTKNYNFDLKLVNTKSSDASRYMCTIANEYGIVRETMRVEVLEEPTIIEILPHGAESVTDSLVTVKRGREVMLTCKVLGSPTPLVRWYKNGKIMPPPYVGYFMENTIKFEPANEYDIGEYTCKAINKLGSDFRTISLNVIPSTLAMKTIMVTDEGQTISLTCESRKLVFNDKPLDLADSRFNFVKNNLVFVAAYQDNGIYKCITYNGSIEMEIETVLIVQVAPLIFPSEDDHVRIRKNGEAVLKCGTRGNPLPKLYWTVNRERIKNSSNFELLKGGDLLIKNAQFGNSGYYICRASNKVGHAERGVTVTVTAPPKVISKFITNIHVEAGGRDSPIICTANGKPKPMVTWYKDGTVHVSGRIGENFLNVGPYMFSGNYTCMAKNVEGEDSRSIQITSQGPPRISSGRQLTKHHFEEYSDISLLCPYSYATDVSWIKDGREIGGGAYGFESYTKGFARPEDSGTYTCIARNKFGERNFTQKVTVFPSNNPRGDGGLYDDVKQGFVAHNLRLDCVSASGFYPRTEWVRNGRIISTKDELSLENLKLNDTGKYECRQEDDRGLVTRIFYVIVLGPPEVQMPMTNWLAIKEGEVLELECLVHGIPAPKITWQQNNKTIAWTSTIFVVSNTSTEMAGEYKCSASNGYGTVDILHHVEILRKPKLKVPIRNLKIRPKDDISLTCKAEGNPLPIVIWTFKGTKLLSSDVKLETPSAANRSMELNGKSVVPTPANADFISGKLTYNKEEAILTIQLQDKRKDAGTFICHAINSVGSEQVAVTVEIIEPPTQLKADALSEITIVAGLPLFLPCPWNADPETTVKWMKNSVPFHKGVSHDQGILSIGVTTVADSGRYSCSATNIGGEATKTFDVKIKGPPFYDIDPTNCDIILKCPPIVDKADHIIWEELLLEDKENITNSIPESSTELTINHDLPTSVYICYHENSGKKSKKLEVQLLQTLPVEYYEVKRVVNVGAAISIYCPLILENLKTRVYWFKSGFRIMNVAGQSFSKNGDVLYIDSVGSENEGIYKCRTGPGKMERGVALRTKRARPAWSNWGTWTPCTKSCGKGMTTRARKCITPHGEYMESDGSFCAGEATEMEPCNDFDCPVNGGWSNWSEGSRCPVKCWRSTLEPKPMGQKLRTCNSPPPSMGGQLCLGAAKDETECFAKRCPIDGGWSPWSSWSACSKSCGSGTRTRKRTCDNPPPQFGGRLCRVRPYNSVRLSKIDANRDNSSYQKALISRLKRDVAFGPPVEGQTSLVFIFDDTASMGNDLKELREGAKKLTREFANRKNNPIYDYILVRFNDPEVRPVIRVNKANKMLEALDEITLTRNYDCPEMAMQGTIDGMSAALPRSQIYVFSDASAKDYNLLDKALKIAQEKQLTVTLLITGYECHPLKQYEAYTELARRTHGQVYNMAKLDVEAVIRSIAEVLDTGLIPIESIYSEAGGTHDFDIFVDSAMKKISATVSGDDPKIDVYDPRKELSKDVKTVLNLKKVKMVKVDNPESGKWNITTSSSSPHSIKISGMSDILVRYGFSFIVPEEFSDTAPSPIKDITNYLSVFVWKNKRNHTFTHAELVIVTPKMEKSHANHTLRVLDPSNCDPDLCIHVTTPFELPLDTFKIYVRGFDSDGNAVKYLVSTNINAVEGDKLKPKVNITEKEVKVKEDDDVELICKVSSVKRAEINWIFENKPVEDNSRRRVNFKRNDTVHLNFYGVTLDDIGNYFCRAKNPYGQHHEKVSLAVEPTPWQIQMVQKDMQAKENEANFEIKCTITPEKRVIPVQWLFNGELLSDSAHFTVAGRTLKLHGVHRKHDGTYTCIGTHNGISLNSTGYLKVLYQPEIFGPLLEEHIVKYEERIVLNCTADGNPKPTMKWIRESGEISSNIIEKFAPSHYGTHICEASNEVGNPAKKYVVLKTKYGLKPKVLMDKNEVSVAEDEGVELTCEVVSSKPVEVSWKFNDEPIKTEDLNRQITSVGDLHILKIPKVQLEHAGKYTCVAKNFNATDNGNVFLRVKDLPLEIKIAEPDMEVLEDTSYEIECIVSPAKRKLNLKWMFGDKILHNSDEFQIAGHSLLIKRIRRTYTGHFTCTGEFYGKTKSSTGYVNVLFKPEIIGPVKETHIVEFGTKVNLNCTAIGNPEPKISWFREDASDGNETIEKFNSSHYGNHICKALNGVGDPAIKVVFLDSKAAKKPQLIHSEYYHEVKTGQNLTLKCGCEQCGPILYKSWSRVGADNRTEIPAIGGVLQNDTKNFNFDLKLVNTKPSDTSRYMCTIANEYGIVRESMSVEVLEEPTIIEILPHGAESVTDGLVKVKRGKEFMLTCKVLGSPTPVVRWHKNGRKLPPVSSYMENTIKFEPANEYDVGKYTCMATNKLGSASKDIILNVIPYNLPMKTVMVTGERQTISLTCESRNLVFNDQPLDLTDSRFNFIENNLVFVAAYQDSGIYKCVTYNGSIETEIETVLIVQAAPLIFPTEDDHIRIRKSGEGILKCGSRGNPQPKLDWTVNRERIKNSDNFELLKGGDLLIKNAQDKNSGYYICRASNKVGHAERGVTVTVTEPPKIISEFITNIHVRPGDRDSPTACIANGKPEPVVTWYRDGRIHVSDQIGENYLNVGSYMLSGNYTCVAKNVEGEDSRSIQITSQGPPLLSPGSQLTKHHFEEYSDISLLCPYSYATDVTWIKDGVEFSGSPFGHVELYNKVFARPEDSGTYTCIARNKFGERNFTQMVTVFPSADPYAHGGPYYATKPGFVGHDLTLDCVAAGDSSPRTKWIRNGRTISMLGQLSLENLKLNDTGKYECKDIYERGSVNRTFYVVVSGPPEFRMPQTNWLAVKEGELTELECLVHGNPSPKISWQYNNKTIPWTNAILVISNTSVEMAGEYKCSASNEYGTVDIFYHIEVLRKPKLAVSISNLKIRPKDDISLTCKAGGNPLPIVIWTFKGTKLLGSDVKLETPSAAYRSIILNGKSVVPTPANANFINGKLIYNKEEASLTIQLKGKRVEAGSFICHAINTVGSEQIETTVEFIDPPAQLKSESPSEIAILAGLPLFLPCPWRADPHTTVKWMKNSAPFHKGVSHDQGILSVGVTTTADGGRYSCSAVNIGGEATKTFVVKVKGRPFYDIDPTNYDIILKCPPIADKADQIIWEEILLEDKENITNPITENSTDLTINHDLPTSVYTCYHKSSASGEKSKKLEVQLLQTLPVEYYDTKRVVNVGDTISMYCPLVLENPKTWVYWFKGGFRIMKVPGQFVSQNGAVLHILSISRGNEGTYTCRTGPGKMERGIILRTKRGTPGWSDWSTWTPCSKSCGKGKKSRTRKCIAPNGKYEKSDGRFCAGKATEIENCNDFECPVNGGWSHWSDWSTCPIKCLSSILKSTPMRQKSRTCNSPSPSMGGQFCLGAEKEESECSVERCPINGRWSPWSRWSDCSVSCGVGTRARRRTCNNPPPQFGGRRCMGRSAQRQQCIRPDCRSSSEISGSTAGAPVDGGWSAWSKWSSCSASCGNSRRVRQRSCTNPKPRDGGRPCSGPGEQTELCRYRAC